jgi:hypothetical protein
MSGSTQVRSKYGWLSRLDQDLFLARIKANGLALFYPQRLQHTQNNPVALKSGVPR